MIFSSTNNCHSCDTMRVTAASVEFYIILSMFLFEVVQSSSIGLGRRSVLVIEEAVSSSNEKSSQSRKLSSVVSLGGQTETVSVSQLALDTPNNNNNGSGNPTASNTTTSNPTSTTTPSTTTTTTTQDPNPDLDEPPLPPNSQDNSTNNKAPNKDDPGGGGGGGGSKDPNRGGNNSISDSQQVPNERVNIELSVLWYSVFMVYVSFVKLIYHNVSIIKRNLTEPGILMIFGIIWELISRQINSNFDVSPRFNSRIFFYLFLPSTVLESASILSNRWLLLNLLPTLMHSIVGTLLYGSAIAFTIHSMSKQGLFNIGTSPSVSSVGATAAAAAAVSQSTGAMFVELEDRNQHWLALSTKVTNFTSIMHQTSAASFSRPTNDDSLEESTFLYEKSYVIDTPMLEVGNLTLADCLIFGSIMSSLDSTTMLGAFSMFQVNERLYYLVLGESLMNNAVVLIVFNLLLDFLQPASKLTVFKIYIAIIQFFITLIGSIFVGLLLASVALLAVRLIKRFQVPTALSSYQNQCLAMIETLLVLKLAYLTYTLGSLAGLSSIVSLATFGVLQDQYIRLNLNLRSQLTFRQVVLATKTMGFSLVYPLLGMLLVDVAYASQYAQQGVGYSQISAAISDPNESDPGQQTSASGGSGAGSQAAAAAFKLTNLAHQASLLWNFKFLSLVTVISVAYRFGIVIILSSFCNLISNRKVKVRLREQLLMAYGGLKGPLAVALVHRLIEHEDHRERLMRNKHLFMYTILFVTLLSVIFKGSFIRPLVEKMQISLDHTELAANQKVVLFNAINNKVIECATNAVNNLMGRSKSPYERLFEFNESRIKPWLARNGSDTYWLSNLYDKMLLDEILDSSSRHNNKSTERPMRAAAGSSIWHSRIHPSESQVETTPRHRGSKSSLKLDTINEHGAGFIDDDELNAMNSHFGLTPRQQQQQQQLATTSKQHCLVRNVARKSKASLTGPGNSAQADRLKELVMLDLRKSIDDSSPSRKRPNRIELAEENLKPFERMLSSSSAGDELRLRRRSSSDIEGYISQLERHLESRRRPSSNRRPTDDRKMASVEEGVARTRDQPAAAAAQAIVAKQQANGTKGHKLRHEGRNRPRKHSKHTSGNKHIKGKFFRAHPNAMVSSSSE